MKKVLLTIIILIYFSSFSFAQSSDDNKKKKIYKWGLEVAINSIHGQIEVPILSTGGGGTILDPDGNFNSEGDKVNKSFSFSIMPKYFLSEDVLIRFELGITKIKLANHFDSKLLTNPRWIQDQYFQDKIYRYILGVQWNFFRKNKFETYCGFAPSFLKYQYSNFGVYNEYRDVKTDTINYWSQVKTNMPGGSALGLGVFAGFDFFFHKHISCGMEISSSMLNYKIGGETTIENSGQALPNPPITSTVMYSNSYKGFKISKLSSSFNISTWF